MVLGVSKLTPGRVRNGAGCVRINSWACPKWGWARPNCHSDGRSGPNIASESWHPTKVSEILVIRMLFGPDSDRLRTSFGDKNFGQGWGLSDRNSDQLRMVFRTRLRIRFRTDLRTNFGPDSDERLSPSSTAAPLIATPLRNTKTCTQSPLRQPSYIQERRLPRVSDAPKHRLQTSAQHPRKRTVICVRTSTQWQLARGGIP